MPDKATDLVQGTLEMLILKTLAPIPMHGETAAWGRQTAAINRILEA